MLLEITIMAVVGMIIGWFTNYLAVKLIFRPFKPWRIPLIGYEIQGLIPKRRAEIAVSIGKTVEEELISVEELINRMIEGENKQEIIIKIKKNMLSVIDDKIPSLIPHAIKQAILSKISDMLNRETESFIDKMMVDVIHKATQSINVSQIVEEKVNNFDLLQLENIILSISKQELKHIELLGGVLGFMIGVIQGILMQFI